MNTRNRLLPLLSLALLSACVVPTGPVEVTRFNRASEGVVYGTGSVSVVLAGETDQGRASRRPPIWRGGRAGIAACRLLRKNADPDIVAEIRYGVVTLERERRSPVSVGVGGSTGSFGSGLGVGVGINLGGGAFRTGRNDTCGAPAAQRQTRHLGRQSKPDCESRFAP